MVFFFKCGLKEKSPLVGYFMELCSLLGGDQSGQLHNICLVASYNM